MPSTCGHRIHPCLPVPCCYCKLPERTSPSQTPTFRPTLVLALIRQLPVLLSSQTYPYIYQCMHPISAAIRPFHGSLGRNVLAAGLLAAAATAGDHLPPPPARVGQQGLPAPGGWPLHGARPALPVHIHQYEDNSIRKRALPARYTGLACHQGSPSSQQGWFCMPSRACLLLRHALRSTGGSASKLMVASMPPSMPH